jgi:hypothetical protein
MSQTWRIAARLDEGVDGSRVVLHNRPRGVIVALISRSRRAVLLVAAVLVASPALAARADAFVFWTNLGDTIGRANLDGTGMDPSFIALVGANPYPSGVAVDASHVYWTDFNAGAIGRANLDGTGVDQGFITGAGPMPSGVTVDGAHLYWTNPGGIGRANLDGTGVDRSFISGGSLLFLGVNEPRGPAVDAAHIYWGDIGVAPTTIGRANLDGTDIEASFVEFGDPTIPLAVAVGGDHVYWANLGVGGSDGTIGRASIDGTGVERSFLTGIGTPIAVAVDDAHIYWPNGETTSHVGSIGRANLDGTGVDPSFIPDPTVSIASAVAVDSSNDFSFGDVEKNTRTGTATRTVEIAEGPGVLELGGTKKVKADDDAVAGPDAATDKLAIKPKGKARKKLNKNGKAKVKAEVTYMPEGSEPKTESKMVTLRKR